MSGLTAYGEGFYISADQQKWSHLGTHVLIVKVPTDYVPEMKNISKGDDIDYVITAANKDVKIMTYESYLIELINTRNPQLADERKMQDVINLLFKTENRKGLEILVNYISQLPDGDPYKTPFNESLIYLLPAFDLRMEDVRVKKQFARFDETMNPYIQKLHNLRRLATTTDFLRAVGIPPTGNLAQDEANIRAFILRIQQLYKTKVSLVKEVLDGLNLSIYGTDTHRAWDSGIYRENQIRPPTLQDLVSLHRTVFPASVGHFHSFYQNRIEGITNEGLRKMANDMLIEKHYLELLQLLRLRDPRGVLRDGPIYITRPSESSENKRGQLFTEEEIYRYMENPFMRVQVLQSTPEGVKAKIVLPANPNLNAELEKLYQVTTELAEQLKQQKNISHDQYFEAATRIASDFYWELSSRHVFWDGSGRTARLVRDQFLNYMGLPPAAFTPENDWLLSKDEMHIKTKEAVRESQDLYEYSFKRVDGNYITEARSRYDKEKSARAASQVQRPVMPPHANRPTLPSAPVAGGSHLKCIQLF